MFVLSCEPATSAVPEWHRELFRGHEEIVSSTEGWSPGSLNLAQAFATKLRSLLAHGDITRLLIDFSRHPDDPERFSRFSKKLTDEQKQKLDERHHRAHLNTLKQRILAEQQRTGEALHLTLRAEDEPGMPTVELLHSGERDIETKFVERWRTALQAAAPDLKVSSRIDQSYGLSRFLREEFATGFGSVNVVVARSCFLDGKPVRWEQLKKTLLATLPQPQPTVPS
ncbi:hypothetical protein OKA04_18780 [Luteolibacter flavescens]|uniref:Uncharacterized protein n=1 Tax=Luteolibacter flavescens TaxID=1859460 RepID=A0ABT3FTN1_9BACT|nr:hypothetical protein [Luteolibacter flavescens]MCW1886792.1 hypothetical protein [Luteolibacter flavescens]